MPSISEIIADRLRELRGKETQEDFARMIGVSRATLANYEAGRTVPRPSVCRRICRKLGIAENTLTNMPATTVIREIKRGLPDAPLDFHASMLRVLITLDEMAPLFARLDFEIRILARAALAEAPELEEAPDV
ncbi:MAG: helix-turn-helix transcriptional regulator [Paracoccus sp. (in: a-proteobacteria)]